MNDTLSGQPLDADLNDHLQKIANAIFSRHGVNPATLQPASGWTNAVWLSDGLALRLSKTRGDGRLLNEARLAGLFPSEVGCPAILESGSTDGFAWCLAVRLPGQSLGEVWDILSWEDRANALQGLWRRAQAVHRVPVAQAAPFARRTAWFNSTDPVEARAALARVSAIGILSTSESRLLGGALERFWCALPGADCVLCHGDLTLDNALWEAGQVTALLDFEFAVLAPLQLDLNYLVKHAFGPESASSPADFHAARQLRRAVKELALPLLAQPQERDLLVGYAILLELCLLEDWLAHPQGEGPLEQWMPLRRMRSLAGDAWGYLAPLVTA